MTATRTFPVDEGIHGMNRMALCLNAAGLAGQWHFAAGTRFDQKSVDVGFDNAEDGGSVGRALSGGLAPEAAGPRLG